MTIIPENRSCSHTGIAHEIVPVRLSAPRAAELATMAPVNLRIIRFHPYQLVQKTYQNVLYKAVTTPRCAG